MAKSPRSNQILVTGAGGKLGRLLRRVWRENPPTQTEPLFLSRGPGADIRWPPHHELENLPECKAVVALWGRTSGPPDTLAENTMLAHHSLALARASGASCVLHFSSAAVYGPGENLGENTPISAAGAYGKAKADMEATISAFPEEGITHCCLRLANVVGADSLAPALKGSKSAVQLAQYPNQQGPLRSYIAPGDLARVLEGLVGLPADQPPQYLNVAAPLPVSMEDLARAAGKKICWMPAPDATRQIVTLDTTRLASLLPGALHFTNASDMIADWRRLETHT